MNALHARLVRLSQPVAPFVPYDEDIERYAAVAAFQTTPYAARVAAARTVETLYRTWYRLHCSRPEFFVPREDVMVGPYAEACARIVKQTLGISGLYDLRLELASASTYWYLPKDRALCLVAAVRAQVYHADEGQSMYVIPDSAFHPAGPGRAYE